MQQSGEAVTTAQADMPTLYTMAGTCSLAPNIAVAWLGAPVDIHNLARGEHRNAAYLAINPQGKVPALRFEDGDVLTEASAILECLGATWGRDAYLRNTPLGRKEAEFLSYMTSEVHSDFAPHFAVQNFADSRAARDEVRAHALSRLRAHFTRLNRHMLNHGGEWLIQRRTFADAYLYVLCRWIDQTPLSIAEFGALAAHRKRMQVDEKVLLALQRQNMKPL